MITKLLILLGFIFSLFLFVFSDLIGIGLKNPDLSIGLKYFSPIPIFLLPTLGIEGIFATYKKAVYVAIYNMVTRIIMVFFIVFPVVFFEGTYLYAVFGWIAGSVISFFIALHFKNIPFKNILSEYTDLPVKEVFKYSLPIVTASIAGIVIKSADQFFISRYFGSEVFAEYANGFIEIPFIGMITGASSTVLMPFFSRVINEKSGVEQIIDTWKNAIIKSALMIYPIVIFFVFNSSEIMTLVYSEKYFNSSVYFQINMMLNFFNIVIFAPLLLSMGKSGLYSRVHFIVAVLMWVSDYLIILVFKDPVAIAINSTVINIFKIFYFVNLISNLLSVKFYDLFPFVMIFRLLFHSVMISYGVKIVKDIFFISSPVFIQLAFSLLIYGGLMLITGFMFKIDYLAPFKPIINRLTDR